MREKESIEHTNHMPGVRQPPHLKPHIKEVPLSEMDVRPRPGTEVQKAKVQSQEKAKATES